MKNFIVIFIIVVCSVVLTSCPATPTKMVHNVVFVHYVEDSLSQYLFADTTCYGVWWTGFLDTVSYHQEWSYPGTYDASFLAVNKVKNGDFLYKCNHDLYVGYPYDFVKMESAAVYNVKWEDAANCKYNDAAILKSKPLDYYILVDIEKIKKYNKHKNITSGEQLVRIVNRMIEDGSFVESIKHIVIQNVCYRIDDYRQYVQEDQLPIISWLLEE